METEKSLVKVTEVKLPAFVENAYETIEGMKEFAQMLLDSRLVPDHFFEKGPDNKPDYTKGKNSAVVVVLLQAQQLEISPLTALQDIVPVNGLLSIKGDLAKTMIFASGKLKKDSWKETFEGSIENENYKVSITATRADNGITITRSFSVDEAKRAGLWPDQNKLNGQDGWKIKLSSWYKYPARMIGYRALGFLARDNFSDVLKNMYITEEAIDMPKDRTEIIDTPNGGKITIPDKEFSEGRSGKMTTRAADKIKKDKYEPVKTDNIQDAEVIHDEGKDDKGAEVDAEQGSAFVPQRGSVETFQGVTTTTEDNGSPLGEGQFTLEEMEKMETKDLLDIVNKNSDMIEAMEIIPGKNTNKKLREIIFAHQLGELAQHVAPYMAQGTHQNEDNAGDEIPGAGAGIKPNLDFDRQGKETPVTEKPSGTEEIVGNKYELEIPDYDKGQERSFDVLKKLYNALSGLKPPIDNPKYLVLAGEKELLDRYADREAFCRYASVQEINELLNSN